MGETVKPGDWVWIKHRAEADPEGAFEWGISGNAAMTGETYVSGVADGWFIPDSPALPQVAAWLAEHPNGLRAVYNVGIENESGDVADFAAWQAFEALVAALGERRNGRWVICGRSWHGRSTSCGAMNTGATTPNGNPPIGTASMYTK